MQIFDVLIVGNGILAYSTAFALFLENPSLKVGIIGPNNRLNGASISAGAMLGCYGEVTESGISSKYGLKRLEMSIEAKKLWPIWLEQINNFDRQPKKFSINPGTFIILNSKSGKLDSDNFEAIIHALKTNNEPFEEVDPAEIKGIKPLESCRPIRSLYLANEGSIDPINFLHTLHNILIKHKNITCIDETIQKIHLNDTTIDYVETTFGKKIKAKRILISAGSYSQFLIEQIPEIKDRIPKLLSGIGYSVLLEKKNKELNYVVRTPNRAGACGLHALPQGDATYVGSSNSLSLLPEEQPRIGMINFLLECFLEQIDTSLYNSNISKFLVGNRPVTADTFPLIGKTSIDNLWILTGTYREGIHQSPLLASLIAKQLLGTETNEHLFAPERKPIQVMNKEQAIKETVLHYTSGAYEHSIELPRIGWNFMLEEMIFSRIERVYEQLETEVGIPPDLLIMIERNPAQYLNYFKNYFANFEKSPQFC